MSSFSFLKRRKIKNRDRTEKLVLNFQEEKLKMGMGGKINENLRFWIEVERKKGEGVLGPVYI